MMNGSRPPDSDATVPSLSPEHLGRLCDWAIAQIRPMVDTSHRGVTDANVQWLTGHLSRLV